jgi:hypothetical protein
VKLPSRRSYVRGGFNAYSCVLLLSLRLVAFLVAFGLLLSVLFKTNYCQHVVHDRRLSWASRHIYSVGVCWVRVLVSWAFLLDIRFSSWAFSLDMRVSSWAFPLVCGC